MGGKKPSGNPGDDSSFKPLHIGKASNVPLLGRTPLMGHLQKVATPLSDGSNYQKLAAFMDTRTWTWVLDYLRGTMGGKHKPYPAYALDGKAGVYPLRAAEGGGPVKLSLVGDWGTGTYEAWKVGESMKAFRPDYTIHLGDVYYVGDVDDVRENFLGQRTKTSQFEPVAFPKGAVGTFALIGNHEMYGGGTPFFTHILPYCETGAGGPQQAPFFCLESEHWRILGLDTGYNSVGKPFIGTIPKLDKVHWVGADGALQQEVLDWLRVNVRPGERKKATLLLSHHQYFTAFRDEYFPRPARQLKEMFAGQEVVWIWGHEHRLSIYDKHSPDGSLTCYARCLGNGGMPVECGTPNPKRAPITFYDARCDYPVGDGTCAGWNGFMNATLDGPTLRMEYRDLNNTLMFAERFDALEDGGIACVLEDAGVMKRV